MSHFTILLGHKTEDDCYDIIHRNRENTSNNPYEDEFPFGFDYMVIDDTCKSEDFDKDKLESIGEIIDNDTELWCCKAIGEIPNGLS